LKLYRLLAGLCAIVSVAVSAVPTASAQTTPYRNVVNSRFNTVSNGPLSTIVVDVPNAADAAAVTRAVADRVNASRRGHTAGLLRELEVLRRTFKWKGELNPGIPEIVSVRQNGRLVIPEMKKTRGPGDELQFEFPLTAAAGDGGWTAAQRAELQTIRDIMYPTLKTIYGNPSWTGTVQVVNADNTTAGISDPNAIWGGVYDVANQRIHFAQYNSAQSKVLNLTQMMAIAFHGPAAISYDAWERGMARAATVEAVRVAQGALAGPFGNNAINAADPLWQAMDRYEWLNQPALGNDRFFPVSKQNGVANTSTFPLMLVPRLIMAGSAWLKVLAESPSFFVNFNNAYYTAFAANPGVRNSIPQLKQIAAAAVPGGQVEGLPFNAWYERQYVLDTSVSPGPKLFAEVLPLRPDTAAEDDFAVGVILRYYQTTFDNSGNSDERNLNGTAYPIYWDYTFQNRLFLAAQYERVDIREGIGTVAPTFFNTIGGDAAQQGRMRVAMDFPVNQENVRVYVAPRSMGKALPPVSYFWGTVVGADTGTMRVQTDTGVDATYDVRQGAFGGTIDAQALSRPTRATLTFTPTGNGTPITRRVNIGYAYTGPAANRLQEYVATFYAGEEVASLTHTFPAGPAMVSFPIRPLKPKAAEAFLNPANDQPLFNDTNLLLAQWRQNLNRADGDNYLRYPNLGPLEPGEGYWTKFDTPTSIKITGRSTALEQEISVGLLHGWNQIGSPYTEGVNINTLRFQYLADNVPVDLAAAIAKGYIVATNVPGAGQVAVWDYNQNSGYVPTTRLEPWKGYWIRVLVSEGLTITYPKPASSQQSVIVSRSGSRAGAGVNVSGWAVPITVRSTDGYGATAYLGQSDSAANGFDAASDTQAPPAFSRSIPAIAFSRADWGANSGDYLSDIRRTGSADPWELTVTTPDPRKSYTLTWADLNLVPRNTRLVLVDTATGQRQYMQGSSGYTFTPGTGATRVFRVQVEQRGASGLQVRNLSVRQTRSGGALELSYDLSSGATVVAEIRGADGRVIRRLNAGRAAEAGTNRVIWDGRDERATSVPSGSYLATVTARTPEGESARVIQPFIVTR
jgi:hypothetical protein